MILCIYRLTVSRNWVVAQRTLGEGSVDTHTAVRADAVIAMFNDQLVDVMRMTPGATSAHVVVGWLPPRNPHTNIIKVQEHSFGLSASQATVQSANRLLEQAGLGLQENQPIVTDDVELAKGQHLGFAAEGDVVVVCVSDSELFTFDFCARLAENIKDVSEAALSS